MGTNSNTTETLMELLPCSSPLVSSYKFLSQLKSTHKWLLKCLGFTCILSLLHACSSGPYTITFNENVVYSPNDSASAVNAIVSDPNLQGCLNQALMSGQVESPEQLTMLACPEAGIESLQGIEKLTNLERIDLSNNDITNLAPLSDLQKLRVLSMRNNQIRNISPLMELPILRFVSLQGNDRISCRQIEELRAKVGNSLFVPESCR